MAARQRASRPYDRAVIILARNPLPGDHAGSDTPPSECVSERAPTDGEGGVGTPRPGQVTPGQSEGPTAAIDPSLIALGGTDGATTVGMGDRSGSRLRQIGSGARLPA